MLLFRVFNVPIQVAALAQLLLQLVNILSQLSWRGFVVLFTWFNTAYFKILGDYLIKNIKELL